MSGLQDTIKMHRARDVQRSVQVELNWFSEPYLKPSNVMYPADDSIKTVQVLLYMTSFDDLLPRFGMSTNEMDSIPSLPNHVKH